MEIYFHLSWLKSDSIRSKVFKLDGARELFSEYVERISKFVPCKVLGAVSRDRLDKMGTKVWVCDRGPGSVELTSEQLAARFETTCASGAREFHIVIGCPDGFSKKELERMKPDLIWSFGPLTFPHELAAVVASEQIYRAWTILRHMPYHSGH